MSLPRVIVLISGSGTNLQALIDAVAEGTLAAKIVLVAANHKDAYGLVRAEKAGIERLYFPLRPYREAGHNREQYDADLAGKIGAYRPNLIVLAGWMHILSPAFLDHFPEKVLNLHPALPGQFAGTQAIERAYEAFQSGEIEHSGCMVHVAIPEVDAGEIVAQAKVPIYEQDSLDDFEERMHRAEHKLIVEAVRRRLKNWP